MLQVRSPSPFQRWTGGKEFGVPYKLHMPFLLFPFTLLNGRFPPLDLFATLGLCQGGKRGRLAQRWKDGQKAILCPVVHPISIGPFSSGCNFHLTQVWKPFLGRGRRKPLYQQQVEFTILLVTEEVGLWFWPLILLRHLNYSYSIRHTWKKEIGLSQVADVSAGMYGWKLIPWHRLMKPAVSCNTEIFKNIFYNTWSQCYIFSLAQNAIDVLTMWPGTLHLHKQCSCQLVKMSRNWSVCLVMKYSKQIYIFCSDTEYHLMVKCSMN